jgi:hypothetical protein
MSNRYAIKNLLQLELFREIKRKIMPTTCDVLAMMTDWESKLLNLEQGSGSDQEVSH